MIHLRNVPLADDREASWGRASRLLASLGPAVAAPRSERGGLQSTSLADSPFPIAATLKPFRSLVVTDEASMATGPPQMMVDQLVSQADNTGLTSNR
ncbi:hypothetical protein HUA78_29930 [Myxococcus sp. CA033]|uniref:hypothetical protein n=1 Tax=Myxococcus sp. CA033 TaxID=2741516 RepID=UPI00157B5990|nr:hypothetical protein [Myxococcus sp. CA033]NTX38674.1 hypothetical protein [Myxococcus sp. CA033]